MFKHPPPIPSKFNPPLQKFPPMPLFALLFPSLSVSHGPGYHSLSVDPGETAIFDLGSGGHKGLFIWEVDITGSEAVFIYSETVDAHTSRYFPNSGSLFTDSSSIRFTPVKRMKLRAWVFPGRLCSKHLLLYSKVADIEQSLTLKVPVDDICMFFDDYGAKGTLFMGGSSEKGRIEIFNSRFRTVANCTVSCGVQPKERVFMRLSGLESGVPIKMKASFERAEKKNLCVRDQVMYSHNEETTQPSLETSDDQWVCSTGGSAKGSTKMVRILLAVGFLVAIVAAARGKRHRRETGHDGILRRFDPVRYQTLL
jgi:hypothetical protein